MSAPAQPAIDALEAALNALQAKVTRIEDENASLKQQATGGVLTDAQATKMAAMQDLAAGLGK
jgi:hypothetical protein